MPNTPSYRLTALGSRKRGQIRLTAETFVAIARAREGLSALNDAEERFLYLLENYRELEEALFDLTAKQMLYSATPWSEFQHDILLVNRRLANLLSATRAYCDQGDRDLVRLFGKQSDIVKNVRDARSRQYDQRFGFRVLETVRNFQQHQALAVRGLAVQVTSVTHKEKGYAQYTIRPTLETSFFRAAGGIKSEVMTELEGKGATVALMPLVREYVEGLGVVHQEFRTNVSRYGSECEGTLKAAMARGKRRFGKALGFAAVELQPSGRRVEVQIFEEFVSRRHHLQRSMQHPGFVSKRYISSHCLDE